MIADNLVHSCMECNLVFSFTKRKVKSCLLLHSDSILTSILTSCFFNQKASLSAVWQGVVQQLFRKQGDSDFDGPQQSHQALQLLLHQSQTIQEIEYCLINQSSLPHNVWKQWHHVCLRGYTKLSWLTILSCVTLSSTISSFSHSRLTPLQFL
jgi:hypothetical protein